MSALLKFRRCTFTLQVSNYRSPHTVYPPLQYNSVLFFIDPHQSTTNDVIVPLLAAVVKIWFPAIAKARRLLIEFV